MIATAGCSRKPLAVPVGSGSARNTSYMDLEPGSTLRIVVPLSTSNLVGYTTSFYAITGHKNGPVRLKFVSAEEASGGNTVPKPDAPMLPFALPNKSEYLRLIYLVRVSQADHNMALVGSRHVDRLNAFTNHLKENPGICGEDPEIFCSWIPARVAVRPESSFSPAR